MNTIFNTKLKIKTLFKFDYGRKISIIINIYIYYVNKYLFVTALLITMVLINLIMSIEILVHDVAKRDNVYDGKSTLVR